MFEEAKTNMVYEESQQTHQKTILKVLDTRTATRHSLLIELIWY
jgi:hypothetical protein